MKTYCDLGKQLSEASDYLVDFPSDYIGSIRVCRSGVRIELSYTVYGLKFQAGRYQSWTDLNDDNNAIIEEIEALRYKLETLGALSWDVMTTKAGEEEDDK